MKEESVQNAQMVAYADWVLLVAVTCNRHTPQPLATSPEFLYCP